jgi:hypothetical protein
VQLAVLDWDELVGWSFDSAAIEISEIAENVPKKEPHEHK